MSTPGAGPTEQLPLFPLSTVLTPGMPLSLHVFEPRYRQLVADLLNDQDPRAPEFGVVALRGGWEVGELRELHPVGTTARVTDVLPLPDGRCDVSAIGERRFVIEQLDTTSRPYLMATVRWLAEPDGRLSVGLLLGAQLAMQRHRKALAQLNVDYLEPEPGPDPDPRPGQEPTGERPDPTGERPDPTGGRPDPTGGRPDPTGGRPDSAVARALSYAVARQSWLPLVDRQLLLACPDTAARLREARAILRRETELVSRLRAVPVTAAAFRS
ncbi:MAG: LON peptidase substrate-binding domain-containing protein [Jatrophihabitantaceae bacterium]